MNIFVLDNDPKVCAMSHCDKHVVKMILETAQMICTTHHIVGGYDYDIPYKSTHVNHPCNRWLRDSVENYNWLISFITHINDEYKYGFSDPEKAVFKAEKGVNHDVVDQISQMKSEPEWMREFRHDALDVLESKTMPNWGNSGILNDMDLSLIHI